LLIKICVARSERSLSLFLKALPLQTLRRALFSFGVAERSAEKEKKGRAGWRARPDKKNNMIN
jgi:hypothetical protein